MNAPFRLSAGTAALADLRDAGELRRIETFVAERGGTPFHQPAWLLAVERGTGQNALCLTLERRGTLAGLLPLTQVHCPLFGRALVSSGFGVGGGIIADDPAGAQILAHAAEELAGRRSCPTIEVRGGVVPQGWSVRSDSHCNFAGPLAQDDEAQLAAIPRKQRAEVRKGLAQDFTMAVGTGEADRAAHYAVYCESVRNLGTPVFPRALFDAVLDAFAEDADILTLRLHGVPVASVLALYHGGAAMPYWGGGTRVARSTRANERMYYELMLHARTRGCNRFDFGRSKNGSGAYHFKKNWGFAPEPLVYASWTAPGHPPRDIDPRSEGYSAKIEAWKRLPLPLANRIGPMISRGLA